MTWRLFDHTADVGIEVHAADHAAALEAAAQALMHVVTGHDVRGLVAERELEMQIEAPDAAALLVAWLSELLWQLDAHDALWLSGGIEVQETDGWRLTARGNVAEYDPSTHGQGTEVKAVTYHDIESRPDGPRWHLRVVLDI